MKVRATRNTGTGLPPYVEGKTYDVNEEDPVTQQLMAAGLLEPIATAKKAPPEPPPATPAKP